jgi:8-amino-3,8-dideoxy-alpha-D-manno-octulosonate transaminase
MPGFEVFGEDERQAINDLFDANGGILFAHGFDALRKGVYRVREFEAAFAAKMGVPHAQAVSSCTAALLTGLKALGVGPGDEVILPCFTFVATCEAVIHTGATPVIVDVDASLNMAPAALEQAVTARTKVVIPVHMMGAPADMDPIMAIAADRGLKVLEDTAQGCGGTYKGRPLGTIGDVGVYSFDAGKVIITGEGGMVVCRDEATYRTARAYHDHGHEYSQTIGRGQEGALCDGFNFRMTELHGAIGLVQLSKLDMILSRQRENKKRLLAEIAALPYVRRTINDQGELGDAIVFFLEDRAQAGRFVEGLAREGLGTKNMPDAMRWHFAAHWEHMFKKYGWYAGSYREQWRRSADILERAIALPVMVNMTDERIAQIGEKLRRIAKDI